MKKWVESASEHDHALPYFLKFREFEKHKRLLRREDIYGSGLPSPEVSREAFKLIMNYVRRSVLDVGCGGGAYLEALEREGYQALVPKLIKNLQG